MILINHHNRTFLHHLSSHSTHKTCEERTNLRGGQTLLGQLEDLLLDIIGRQLQPLNRKKGKP